MAPDQHSAQPIVYSLSIFEILQPSDRGRDSRRSFFFLLLLITKLDIDFYLCGLSGFYFFCFSSMCVRKPLKNAAHKMSIP